MSEEHLQTKPADVKFEVGVGKQSLSGFMAMGNFPCDFGDEIRKLDDPMMAIKESS